MKRATRDEVTAELPQRGTVISWEARRDILDSDARQRAEIRRLRAQVRDREARLSIAERAVGLELVWHHESYEGSIEQRTVRAAVAACDLTKALAPKRRARK